MQKVFVDYPVETLEFNTTGERLIIMLHGFGASTFSWRTVTKDLAQMGHVIAYDRPAKKRQKITGRGGDFES
jgi:alpha-beta hydrolase superfamily lysophospholipase